MIERIKSYKHRRRLWKMNRASSDLHNVYMQKESHNFHGRELDASLVDLGFLTLSEQAAHVRVKKLSLIFSILAPSIFFLILYDVYYSLIAGVLGAYIWALMYAIWKRSVAKEVLRKIYFQAPLVAEELVLLVRSGLALSPAIHVVCSEAVDRGDLLLRYLKNVHELSSQGLGMSESFKVVADSSRTPLIKHFMLHLESTVSVGGELSKALQALADQIHQEWKLSVEMRIKRLENLVVFPVFSAVLGLMLLTASVPLIPIYDFMSNAQSANQAAGLVSKSVEAK